MRSLADVRRFAVGRLFTPTGIEQTLEALAFVQADPIRAPARAQDLTLRPRVVGYRAGDLERLYSTLPIEEDVFINYGFVTRAVQALMHPRNGAALSPTAANARAKAVLAFIRERGTVHPREVDAKFAHRRCQLLGRLLQRHHAPAGGDALQGSAPRGTARSRYSHLRASAARSAARERCVAPRASRCARRRPRSKVFAGSVREPVVSSPPSEPRRAAVAR